MKAVILSLHGTGPQTSHKNLTQNIKTMLPYVYSLKELLR